MNHYFVDRRHSFDHFNLSNGERPVLAVRKTRFYSIVARMACGDDPIVVLSNRLKRPVVVAFGTRTLLFDPQRAGLRDVMLAGRLLRYRYKAHCLEQRENEFPFESERVTADDNDDGFDAAYWLLDCEQSLREEFPRIHKLDGHVHWNNPETYPELVWNKVDFEPLTEGDLTFTDSANLEMSEICVNGDDDDLEFLRLRIASGQIRHEHWEHFPEMPIVELLLTIPSHRRPGLRFEQYVHEKNQPFNKRLRRRIRQCYERRTTSLRPLAFRPVLKAVGQIIDTIRLVNVVTARSGRPPRIFKDVDARAQHVFRPNDHLVVVAFQTHFRGNLNDLGLSMNFLTVMMEAFRELRVDLIVAAFSDQVLPLEEGEGHVYVHVPTILKTVEQEWDDGFFNRFAAIIDAPPLLPTAKPAFYHPLIVRTVGKLFQKHGRHRDYRYWTLAMAAKRGMSKLPGFQEDDAFISRTAQYMDEMLLKLSRTPGFSGRLDTMFGFIPDRLRDAGRKGGRVNAMF